MTFDDGAGRVGFLFDTRRCGRCCSGAGLGARCCRLQRSSRRALRVERLARRAFRVETAAAAAGLGRRHRRLTGRGGGASKFSAAVRCRGMAAVRVCAICCACECVGCLQRLSTATAVSGSNGSDPTGWLADRPPVCLFVVRRPPSPLGPTRRVLVAQRTDSNSRQARRTINDPSTGRAGWSAVERRRLSRFRQRSEQTKSGKRQRPVRGQSGTNSQTVASNRYKKTLRIVSYRFHELIVIGG